MFSEDEDRLRYPTYGYHKAVVGRSSLYMEPVYSNFSGGQPSQVKIAWVTLWPDT
jgi:hypothetical protein